jgi:CubicO group peptidase (beta-lactamase class C family)
MEDPLAGTIDRLAEETRFAGVVRVDRGAGVEVLGAYGLADRLTRAANAKDTLFGIASGTKSLTALAVMSLIDDGTLKSSTTARSLLGRDLPLIDDAVTVEQLLAHRSGIGDYMDEDAIPSINDFTLPIPASELIETEDYLRVLGGFTMKFPPGERFSYCNGGYVVLALIAERALGIPFHTLVRERVCGKAGMNDTDFYRSDELPERAAVGYLDAEGTRTNAALLPVRGSGDGGIYSTASEIHALWDAMFAGRILPMKRIEELLRPRSTERSSARRHGLGFWIHPSREVAIMVGADAGVSFYSARDPSQSLTFTVMSNTTDGAWPIARHLRDTLTP